MSMKIRTVRFAPYVKFYYGKRMETFTLELYEPEASGWMRVSIPYKLKIHETIPGKKKRKTTVIFDGSDFSPALSIHNYDSDEVVSELMGFLTLKPGDTDDDYFKDYTEAQLSFANWHAEALSYEVERRFNKNNEND